MKTNCFHFLISVAILGILAAGFRAESAPPSTVNNFSLSAELSKKLEAYAQEGMKKWHAPGLAIGIVKGDQLVWSGYFGYADLKNQELISENSVFETASVSKTFTAIGIMQEYEQGKFQLDAPVNQFAPYALYRSGKKSCRQVTFLDILTHTSGAGELMSWRQIAFLLPTLLVPDNFERPSLKALFIDGIRPEICPGTKFAYCNFCFGGLGLILEQLSGETFNNYMDEHILKPLGMTHSHFYETDDIIKNLATGYTQVLGKYEPIPFMRYPVTPMCGLYSTVPDMSRYLIALLNNGRLGQAQILKSETLSMMFTPHYSVDTRLEKIGLCFFIQDFYGHKLIGHDGANPGYGTQMYIAPDDKIGIIVFANIMNDSAYEIGHGLLKILLQIEKQERDFAEARNLWQNFIGDYGSIEPELLTDLRFYQRSLGVYRIRVKNDQLWMESANGSSPRRLRQVHPDDPYFYEIIIPDSEIPRYLVFTVGENGIAKSIKIGLNEYVRVARHF